MSTVTPETIVDKNGKITTVHKKQEGSSSAPKPRPVPKPTISRPLTEGDRNAAVVQDLALRLNANIDLSKTNVSALDANVYVVETPNNTYLAFDNAKLSQEPVSGFIYRDEDGGLKGKLLSGSGVSNTPDSRGYAVPSGDPSREAAANAAEMANQFL